MKDIASSGDNLPVPQYQYEHIPQLIHTQQILYMHYNIPVDKSFLKTCGHFEFFWFWSFDNAFKVLFFFFVHISFSSGCAPTRSPQGPSSQNIKQWKKRELSPRIKIIIIKNLDQFVQAICLHALDHDNFFFFLIFLFFRQQQKKRGCAGGRVLSKRQNLSVHWNSKTNIFALFGINSLAHALSLSLSRKK